MAGKAARLNWVDTAKGLSIILVVMMHSAYGVGQDTGGTGVLHWIIAFATPFRMPEFFLISGLFLSMVIGRDWKAYADRRVVHYLYFYAIWAVIHIGFKVAISARDPGGAASALAWAVVEPYGVLWFIYMLAVFSAAAKICHQLRLPHWLVVALAAALQIAPLTAGPMIVTEFAEYFVFFYLGYAAAPLVFKLVEWVDANPAKSAYGLLLWAVANGLLVFSPGYAVLTDHVEMGIAALPGVRLVLAVAGSLALCVFAALLSRLKVMEWLRWLGERSIVVYLAFALPMGISRVVLIKLGLTDTSILSIAVMVSAIVAPLLLLAAINWTGKGKFLFERPAWAHLPGTKGSRWQPANVQSVAAE